ncbi:response regulator transcription factor [Nodosilinea sp. LEGE 07298]|jgi:DNA-binding NarL/FixJ family response regulator|uniref:response regulator n=1 Tax=Nodosilinea sp. LEGE 07298 TaxID=2777970 RepID=UPI00187EA5A4|nr:response regulator transcription factor [Nodosilinea sp. LEGE 07298]MBE9107861.1 response regulator transcription factor [Nodosilinea sp. LEGE 07298]
MTDIRIVLIEDHDLTRLGLKAALQRVPGMTVVGEAANGARGLSLLETEHPDIAIVDIGLPDIDGIELVERLRQSQGDSENPTRVLMLTMHDSEAAVMAAFAAGADSYCMKQTELDDLIVAVRETYEGNSWIDPAVATVVLRQVRKTPAGALAANNRTVAIEAVEPEFEQILESYPLTERELEILELIVGGCSNAEIAERSYITVGTVKTHVRSILNKLGVDDRTKAAVRALRSGLVT